MTSKGTMSTEEMKDALKESADLGRVVTSLLQHNGWKLFLTLYRAKKKEILLKDDYNGDLRKFDADRGAIKIVDGLITELLGFVENAESSVELLQKIADKAEDQTPENILAVDIEDEIVAEG